MKKFVFLAMFAFITSIALSQATLTDMNKNVKTVMPDTTATGPVVKLETTLGDITLRLFDDTPGHRDNFVKLVNEGYYDGMLFHRVIKDFMVQTGDPNSKKADNTMPLGAGDPGYTQPAEILYPRHFHKYGALAAARTADQVNPERRSSGSQFYIVTGQTYSPSMLKRMEGRMNDEALQNYFMKLQKEHLGEIKALREAHDTTGLNALRDRLIAETEANVKRVEMPAEVIETYSTIGGTPHLDGAYTVFGEVLSGMETVEKIQNVAVDGSDNPKEPVKIISAKIVK